jgi:hypothetical protein
MFLSILTIIISVSYLLGLPIISAVNNHIPFILQVIAKLLSMYLIYIKIRCIYFSIKYPAGCVLNRSISWVPGVKHTGISVGNGKVIHFHNDENYDNRVRISTVEEFSDGELVTVNEMPSDSYHAREIVQRAKICYYSPEQWNGRYNMPFRNCVTFTRHCFYG